MWSRMRQAKVVMFVACLAPLFWLAWTGIDGGLGANPVEAMVRTLGDWSLRMLLVALAVTPVRQITGWGSIGGLRRMLGLFAFAYTLLHLSAYVGLDQFFDWPAISRELVRRRYIMVGMASFFILTALAATSANVAIRRLGGLRWRALHRLVYPAAVLAAAHHLMMVKADVGPPLLHILFLGALLGWRLARLWRFGAVSSLIPLKG